MDLQGKIEKFNVPDIFQLIATGKRTGTLGIVRHNQATMFYFKDGQITYAYAQSKNGKIGGRLLDKGFINKETLDKSLDQQKREQGKNRLGRILLENKNINEQQLATILTEQISDIVYKVMAWDRGVFKFYDNTFPTSEDQLLSLSTESLVLEGAKKADEIANLRSKLPDFNQALRLKKKEGGKQLNLTAEQWNLLACCDGHRSIYDIISQMGDDTLAILNSLDELIKDDLLEPVETENSGSIDISRLELQVGMLAELLNSFLQKA